MRGGNTNGGEVRSVAKWREDVGVVFLDESLQRGGISAANGGLSASPTLRFKLHVECGPYWS